jgi:hypothetical protein
MMAGEGGKGWQAGQPAGFACPNCVVSAVADPPALQAIFGSRRWSL